MKLTEIVRKHFGLVEHVEASVEAESSASCSENIEATNSEQHSDNFSTGGELF